MRHIVFFNDDTGRGRITEKHIGCVVYLMSDGERVSRHSLKRRPIVGRAVRVDGRIVVVEMVGASQ